MVGLGESRRNRPRDRERETRRRMRTWKCDIQSKERNPRASRRPHCKEARKEVKREEEQGEGGISITIEDV